jgi:hypothetical protein
MWTAGATKVTGDIITGNIWNSYAGADGSVDFIKNNYLAHDYYTVITDFANGTTTGFQIIEDGASHVYTYAGRLSLISDTTDNDAFIQSVSPNIGYFVPTAGKKFVFIWGARNLLAATAFELWLLQASEAPAACPPMTATASHVGFFINGTAIYATNADGVTQKITTTGIVLNTSVQYLNLKAVWTYGTDIKYYINGVLKVTHTVNIPTLDTTHLYNTLAFRSKFAGANTAYINPTSIMTYEGE